MTGDVAALDASYKYKRSDPPVTRSGTGRSVSYSRDALNDSSRERRSVVGTVGSAHVCRRFGISVRQIAVSFGRRPGCCCAQHRIRRHGGLLTPADGLAPVDSAAHHLHGNYGATLQFQAAKLSYLVALTHGDTYWRVIQVDSERDAESVYHAFAQQTEKLAEVDVDAIRLDAGNTYAANMISMN